MDGSRGRERRAGGRRDGLRPPSGGKLGLSRRELLLLAGASVGGPLLGAGCGGGGSNAGTLSEVPIQVNRSEIGSGGLWASSFAGHVLVPEGQTTASLPVRGTGAQTVFLTDSQGEIQAAAVSIPTHGRQGTHLVFDAASSCLALMMLTPGIGSAIPAEASSQADAIRALPTFPALTDAVRAALPSATLHGVITSGDVLPLFTKLLVEWQTKAALASRSRDVLVDVEDRTGTFGLELGSTNDQIRADPTKVRFELRNYAWRSLQVVRDEYQGDTLSRRISVSPNLFPPALADCDALAGVNIEWSDVLTWVFRPQKQFYNASSLIVNMGPVAGCSRSDFWAFGPGRPPDPLSMPPGMSVEEYVRHIGHSVAWTVFDYVVWPTICLGVGEKVEPSVDAYLTIGPKIKDIYAGFISDGYLDRLRSAMRDGNIGKAILETGSIARYWLEAGGGVLWDIIISQFNLDAGDILRLTKLLARVLDIVKDAGNLATAVGYWITMPELIRTSAYATGSTGVVVR